MDVPPEAQLLLVSLLAKDPAARPPSARAVADRLDAVLHDLVEREGVHTLEEFVRDGFASARDERQKAIQTALDGLDTASSASAVRAPRRSGWAFAALAAVALASAAAVALAMTQAQETEPSSAAGEVELPAPTAVAAPPRPVEVTVEVQTVPPGATLEMDGMEPQTTPASLQLEHSSTPRAFTLRLDGYATRQESIVPDESRRLELVLSEVEPPVSAREHRRPRPRERREPTKSRPSSLDTYW